VLVEPSSRQLFVVFSNKQREPSTAQFDKRSMLNCSAQYKKIKTSKLSILALSVLFNHLGISTMKECI